MGEIEPEALPFDTFHVIDSSWMLKASDTDYALLGLVSFTAQTATADLYRLLHSWVKL